MSVGALLGLLGLNLIFLAAGASLLWAVRGFAGWAELARLAGLAYMLGLAVVSVLLVVELVLGVPFGAATVVLTALAAAAAGVVAGRARRRSRPAPQALAQHGGPVLITALGAALMIVFLEAVFRAGRLAGLFEWDAMSFWVPKAKVIYFLGGLDERFFSRFQARAIRRSSRPSKRPRFPSWGARTW